MKCITNRANEKHITPLQDAMWHRGILGVESCIFNYFDNFKTTIITNNEISIASGIGAIQGRFFCVEPGTHDTISIANGVQGQNRIDIICAEYTVDAANNTQDCKWTVLQGESTAGTAVPPILEAGDIDKGDLIAQEAFFEVRIEGLTITNVSPICKLWTLPKKNGGTDATTAEEALANLGVYNLHKSIKNYLDNSDFRKPVNQRGATQYVGACYGIDRWYTTVEPCMVTVEDGFVRMGYNVPSNPSSFTTKSIEQKIDIEEKKLAGKQVTLVAKVRGNQIRLMAKYIQASPYITSDDWTILAKAFTVPENAESFFVGIQGQAASTWDCEWIALYEGEFTPQTAPPYTPKGYAEELHECYRYFWKVNNYAVFPGYKSSTAYGFVYLPVPMRTTPTVTMIGESTKSWIYYGGARQSGNAPAAVFAMGNIVRISITETTPIGSNQSIMWLTSNGGIELSADL